MDHVTPEKRSWLMSQVKSKDTSAERRVRRTAHALGLRFRLQRRDLPGTPDLTFPKHRTVVFVHGCFWHRHTGCQKATFPKSRVQFWQCKFERTIARDLAAIEELRSMRWRVAIIWECETRVEDILVRRINDIFDMQ